MCGIAGLWLTGGSSADGLRAAVAAMTAVQAHRGPDDEGVWVDAEAGIGLGHRRLAIIDCSPTGHQPMVSACGRLMVVFNGEIYNFRSIAAELEEVGHGVRARSDTAVLLEACAAFGVEGFLRRAVGMFAFALWDRHARTLVLARDRLGKKPLYWRADAAGILFGSQPKVLLAAGGWEARVSPEAMAAFCRYGYVPGDRSILEGVAKVAPGTFVTFAAAGPPAETVYWSALDVARRGEAGRFQGNLDAAADALGEVLGDAVGLRMVADVPLGAFLSGGIDSSLVVALMQARSARPVRTFSIGFNERGYDESADAERVARHLGTEHLTLVARPDDALAIIPRLPEWYDEPFADSSQLPTLLLARLVRDHVTVALSGDGGDELFGGYNRHVLLPGLARRASRIPAPARRIAATAMGWLSPAAWDLLGGLLPGRLRPRQLGDKLYKVLPLLSEPDLHAMYGRVVSQWPRPPVRAAAGPGPERPPLAHPLDRLRFLDMTGYLADDILVKVDRATMAFSLEARAPLLDHRVVEWAWTLPPGLLVHGGLGKVVMRRLLERHVPAPLWDRPKSGFAAPIDSWLRGPLREWAEDLLSPQALDQAGLFDTATIRAAWNRHVSGRENLQHRLWCVLMAQQWLRAVGSGSIC